MLIHNFWKAAFTGSVAAIIIRWMFFREGIKESSNKECPLAMKFITFNSIF